MTIGPMMTVVIIFCYMLLLLPYQRVKLVIKKNAAAVKESAAL